MLERFARSWELTRQSAAVLAQNKSLMVFPILSAIAGLVAILSFFMPFILSGRIPEERGPQFYVLAFLFYFVAYLIQIFFSCALMGAANMAFSGGRARVSDGLGMAWERLPQILFYSVIAATVGLILRMLEERVGLLGRIVIALMGAAWSILTYFMVPVIVMEGAGGFDGVRRSAELVKTHLGRKRRQGAELVCDHAGGRPGWRGGYDCAGDGKPLAGHRVRRALLPAPGHCDLHTGRHLQDGPLSLRRLERCARLLQPGACAAGIH